MGYSVELTRHMHGTTHISFSRRLRTNSTEWQPLERRGGEEQAPDGEAMLWRWTGCAHSYLLSVLFTASSTGGGLAASASCVNTSSITLGTCHEASGAVLGRRDKVARARTGPRL